VAIARGKRTAAFGCVVLVLAGGVLLSHRNPEGRAATKVTAWSPPGTPPISDPSAASLVSPAPENVPDNAGPNQYVPSRTELLAFRATPTSDGRTAVQFNPLLRYVTGRPGGMSNPTTDELVQWVSHKWGIPTNVIRGQLVLESQWRQGYRGDRTQVPQDWYPRYPRMARILGGTEVYQSLGIAQVKWTPDGSVHAGTEPLRWKSTAFNLDYYAATVRYYYDGLCGWCGPNYSAGQPWNSPGAWYSPNPWANDSERSYVRNLIQAVTNRSWTQIGG
jgi:hypothetical protein